METESYRSVTSGLDKLEFFTCRVKYMALASIQQWPYKNEFSHFKQTTQRSRCIGLCGVFKKHWQIIVCSVIIAGGVKSLLLKSAQELSRLRTPRNTMNSMLFQFIESKNLARNVGKKDNTQLEKMTEEDPGILPLRKLIIGKQLPEPHTLFSTEWTTSTGTRQGWRGMVE